MFVACNRNLRCPRNTLHVNLFVSFILRAFVCFLRDWLIVHGIGLPGDILVDDEGHVIFRQDITVSDASDSSTTTLTPPPPYPSPSAHHNALDSFPSDTVHGSRTAAVWCISWFLRRIVAFVCLFVLTSALVAKRIPYMKTPVQQNYRVWFLLSLSL